MYLSVSPNLTFVLTFDILLVISESSATAHVHVCMHACGKSYIYENGKY